jgi:hypothetical protein
MLSEPALALNRKTILSKEQFRKILTKKILVLIISKTFNTKYLDFLNFIRVFKVTKLISNVRIALLENTKGCTTTTT